MDTVIGLYACNLRFRIDSDAPDDYLTKWNNIKNLCEKSGEHRDKELIVNDILKNCKLESNKQLPYLNRFEGGLGHSSNHINKQIRFRMLVNNKYTLDNNNDIILDVQNAKVEKWTLCELDDIIYSFLIVLNRRLGSICTNACIELVNKRIDF